MKYLIARSGRLSLPKFQEVDDRQCIEMGGVPYNGGDAYSPGGGSGYPDETAIDTFFQNLPTALSNEAPTYIWYSPGGFGYHVATDIVPKIKIDGQTLEPDPNPTNGHISWGGGKVRWSVSEFENNTPRLGYIYEKKKPANSWEGRLFSYTWNGKHYRDGWYELDTDYVEIDQPYFNAYPKGSLLDDADTSSTISGEFEFPNHYMGDSYTEVSALSDSSQVKHFGLPWWTGYLPNISSTVKVVGVPLWNEELSAIDMEFLYYRGTGSNSEPRNYYRYYRDTDRYTESNIGISGDVRSIYPRGHLSGWWEFEPPDSVAIGSTFQMHYFTTPGGQQTDTATFTLSGFITHTHTEIDVYANPDTSEKKHIVTGMLLGVFNVGTVIY